MGTADARLFFRHEMDIDFDAPTLFRLGRKLKKTKKENGVRLYEVNSILKQLPGIFNPTLPEGYNLRSVILKQCPSLTKTGLAYWVDSWKLRVKQISYGLGTVRVYHTGDAMAIHKEKIRFEQVGSKLVKVYKHKRKPFYKKAIQKGANFGKKFPRTHLEATQLPVSQEIDPQTPENAGAN